MYETLGMDVDKGYQPIVKSSKGEDMGAFGQVTFTFKINDTPFTQSFIVCRHMAEHMILGTDFTAMKTDAFQWKDHHRTTRLNIRCPLERSHNLDRSFRNSYIIPSFPTREQHARSVQNARSRFNKLNQSYSC